MELDITSVHNTFYVEDAKRVMCDECFRSAMVFVIQVEENLDEFASGFITYSLTRILPVILRSHFW